MNLYKTKHQGLAAALRHSLGSNVHTGTVVERDGVTFEFYDSDGLCRGIAKEFFAGSLLTTNAKALLDELFKLRKTISVAIAQAEKRNEE